MITNKMKDDIHGSNISGQCPICNSLNLTYKEIKHISGNDVCFPFICDACNAVGREYHILTYKESEAIL